jgi:hypothetical protein
VGHWERSDGRRSATAIKGGSDLGGKIGGWTEVLDQIRGNNPDNYAGQLDAFANALIREINQQYSQGVGLAPFSEELQSVQIADTALSRLPGCRTGRHVHRPNPGNVDEDASGAQVTV